MLFHFPFHVFFSVWFGLFIYFYCIGRGVLPVFFFLYKGASSLDLDDTDIARALKWALGLGGGLALITIPTALPYIKRKVATSFNEDGTRRRVRGSISLHSILFHFISFRPST